MESYVITIKTSKNSQGAADNCIKSILKFHNNLKVEKFFGYTPKDDPQEMFDRYQYPSKSFRDQYSRAENAMAAFLSHHKLWKYSVKSNKPIFIFEHDAELYNPLPISSHYNEQKKKFDGSVTPLLGNIVNLGHPSYGNWNIPSNIGINPLTTKQYFPGAHAYFIRPAGAKMLVDKAKEAAAPTDVYINNINFKGLQEWFPFCAAARDKFSTIQKLEGCRAKHGFVGGYKLVKV